MDEVTKTELERIRDEEKRQNKRLEGLEDDMKELRNISLSVEKLAINMQHMLEEMQKQSTDIKDQSERISKLENEPADKWNSARRTVLTAIVSAVVGAVILAFIQAIAQYL